MVTLLDGIRVLDLATVRGELAGRVLADLGAEVLKIEPPGGAAARRLPPFEADEKNKPSLYWSAVALGKLGAMLDIHNIATDRERLRELVKVSDVLIESDDPGVLEALGLGAEALRAINPRLVYASLTPYGQSGPKALWPASDLTIQSIGGRVALQGDQDRQPIPVGYPHQSAFQAAVQVAADVIIALNERELSGLGQRLDTSMAECMVWSLLFIHGWPTHEGRDPVGVGDDRGTGVPYNGVNGGTVCADGSVLALANAIQMGNIATQRLIPALEREGLLTDSLKAVDWDKFADDVRESRPIDDVVAILQEAMVGIIAKGTKKQWQGFSAHNGIGWAPINTTKDLLESDQLAARNYWTKVGDYLHNGPEAILTRTPIVYQRPEPTKVGQDQAMIDQWLATPPLVKTQPVSEGARLGEAFAGLKVADFTWIATGPVTTKSLADHGAIVVKMESEVRTDPTRLSGPFRDGIRGLNRSFHLSNWNSSKLGVTINLQMAEGKELARKVIDWADVVVDNYSAGTMDRLGFGYDVVSRDHPELIMMSSSLMGETGPWKDFAGGGGQGAAIAGFHAITGWPDRAAVGPAGAYTDLLSARFSEAVLAAAVFERRRSGKGQFIDMSQVEATMHCIEPLLLDQSVNGRTAPPAGLTSDVACPNGTYPVEGTKRYIAISVETAEQWRMLRSMATLGDFADPKYDDIANRRAVNEQIDAQIAKWTAGFDRFDLERKLCTAGIPAAVVTRPSDMQMDEQFKARGFFLTLDHPEMGPSHYDGLATHFSAKREMLHLPAPLLGQHTEYVMHDLLGLSDDAIAAYAATGALT